MDIHQLDKSITRSIIRKIECLLENAETINRWAYAGILPGLARRRDGNYRIIYELLYKEQVVVIHFVGHRSEVYKGR